MHTQAYTGIVITMPVHMVIRSQYPCGVDMVMLAMIVVAVSMLAMTFIAVPFSVPAFFYMTFM